MSSAVVDDGEFYEVHEHWARNILSDSRGLGCGRDHREPAESSHEMPDINASVKGAVRAICDAFNIPLLVFEDVPGFLPASIAHSGIIEMARNCCAVLRSDRAGNKSSHEKRMGRVLRHGHVTFEPTLLAADRRNRGRGRRARSVLSTRKKSMRPRIRKPSARS
jgi:hypothetical protein